MILFSALYSGHVSCQCYSCVGTIQSDVKCKTNWVLHNNTLGDGGKSHETASTPAECQKACEFDPGCVADDWRRHDSRCLLNTNPTHNHSNPSVDWWDHYELVSRCSITSGQCFFLSSRCHPWLNKNYKKLSYLSETARPSYVIVRPLSTVGYTSVVASVIHSRQWSN